MKALELENYGVMDMNHSEQQDNDGGGPWWYELAKTILHSAAYDTLKAGVVEYASHNIPSPSGTYHNAMSSANHGGIR
jgi:hypothetical protein